MFFKKKDSARDCSKLYESITRRTVAVIKAKDGSTPY
jgi:hypothetical protein